MNNLVQWTIGTIVTALTLMGVKAVVKSNKRLKNAASKQDLEDYLKKSKGYTDEKIKIHEDKQVLELARIIDDVSETKEMVTFLYQNALKK